MSVNITVRTPSEVSGVTALQTLTTISNSIVSGNTQFGIYLEQPAGVTECNVEHCVIGHNGTGVAVAGGAPTVRLSDSTIVNNGVGIQLASGTV